MKVKDEEYKKPMLESSVNPSLELQDLIQNKKERELTKMGPTEAFFAMLKAYCAINILLLPNAFA